MQSCLSSTNLPKGAHLLLKCIIVVIRMQPIEWDFYYHYQCIISHTVRASCVLIPTFIHGSYLKLQVFICTGSPTEGENGPTRNKQLHSHMSQKYPSDSSCRDLLCCILRVKPIKSSSGAFKLGNHSVSCWITQPPSSHYTSFNYFHRCAGMLHWCP